MAGNCAQELVSLIRDIIGTEINKQDATVICVVSSTNEDGSLNIMLPPDRTTIIKNIVNSSKYDFRDGELGVLYKIQNSLNNSFVMAKVAPSQVSTVEGLLKRIERIEAGEVSVSGGGGAGGGGTVTSVRIGAGLEGSTIISSGTVALGTPSDIGLEEIEDPRDTLSSTSHTHNLDPALRARIEAGETNIIEGIIGADGEIVPDENKRVTIAPEDIGAAPTDHSHSASQVSDVVTTNTNQSITGEKIFKAPIKAYTSTNDTDGTVIRMGDGGEKWNFDFRYLGSGSGNNNILQLRADNQTDNDTNKKTVFEVTQDGDIGFEQNAGIRGEKALKFGGSSSADNPFEIKYNASTNSLDFNYLL